MWYARIDIENQRFIIFNGNDEVIATRIMPTTILPNPGEERLMNEYNNWDAWEKIQALVNAANGVNEP